MICRAFLAAVTLLALTLPSFAQEKLTQSGEQDGVQILILDGSPVGTEIASRVGEICLVCNKPIAENDLTYLVHGQRVPVHRVVCNTRLREDPRAVLASLRPRGAFLSAELDRPELSDGWFVFGLYILLGLFFGAVCAQRALKAGRNPVPWALAGLAFNIVGYTVLLSLPHREYLPPAGIPAGLGKIAATYAPAVCPTCGRTLHPTAASCPACGAALRPKAMSEVATAMHAN